MKKIKELNFDLKQLRSFQEALREHGFTRASRKLKVGQATISHHISQLEKSLGVKLINRTAHDLSATEEGKVFQDFCNKLFGSIETLVADLGGEEAPRTIRIASSTVPSAFILPGLLAAVAKDFPSSTFRVAVSDSRESMEMVKEGRADIGIVGKEYRHPALVFKPVCRDEIVLAGPMDFPARVTPADLAGLPFIMREPGSGTRKSSEEALGEHGIVPSSLNVVMECSSTEGILESIAAGIGVSFVSSLAISSQIKLKMLKIIEVKGIRIVRNFYFMYPDGKALTRQAALLLKLLLEFGKTGKQIPR